MIKMTEEQYKKLNDMGMLFEFFPNFTGDYKTDIKTTIFEDLVEEEENNKNANKETN